MKKLLVILMIVGMGTAASQAQRIMEKGSSLVNLGVGFVPGWGVSVSYDYGLIDTWGPGIFTVGGYIGRVGQTKHYDLLGVTVSDYSLSKWFFSPRASYRYAINGNFEVFGALMLGGCYQSFDTDYFENEFSPFLGLTAGCRYSFTDHIAVFAETTLSVAGYSITCLNGGISFSF
jgi:hypothetical protein